MVHIVDGGGLRFAKSSGISVERRTSPGKRGRLVTLAYLPWWKSEPNFENRLTAIFFISRDKSLAITQHDNADNGPPLVIIFNTLLSVIIIYGYAVVVMVMYLVRWLPW